MAKKRETQNTQAAEAPVDAVAETATVVEVVPEENAVRAFDALATRDDPEMPSSTVPTEGESEGESEDVDIEQALSAALSQSSAALAACDWDSTSALTDAQIQTIIAPILDFAGTVAVETAGPVEPVADADSTPGD